MEAGPGRLGTLAVGVCTPWIGKLWYKASKSSRWIVYHSLLIIVLTLSNIALVAWSYFVGDVPGGLVLV